MSWLDPELMRRLERIRLSPRQLLPSGLQGEHRARNRGGGIEFADYRAYVEGDDVRRVDWRAYLRHERLIVHLFDEEGDLALYVLLDTSESMAHSDPQKLELAKKLAACLTYLALCGLDRVTLVPWADGARAELGPLHGRAQAGTAFRYLESLEPGGETRLSNSIREAFARPKRRGLTIVISDFLTEGAPEQLDRLLPFRHDVLALQITSQADHPTPRGRDWMIEDSETGARVRIRPRPGLERDLREAAEDHVRSMERVCRRRGWGFARFDSEASAEQVLLDLLARRNTLSARS